MQIKALSRAVSVSPQIAVVDVSAIASQGFRTIMCNRPDGESADQTDFDTIAAAAERAGISALYLPIIPGHIGQTQANQFAHAVTQSPGPVLAYCRTGTRSATLWALTQLAHRPVDDVLAKARAAGYELSGALGPSAPA